VPGKIADIVDNPLEANPMRPFRLAALAAAFAIPVVALAQTPAPAQSIPAPPPGVEVPKPTCKRPDEYPGNLASDLRKKAWDKDVSAYIDCMKKFIEEQTGLGNAHYTAAQRAIESTNKDIQDFNAAKK
jgi:hypothetical protein